MPQIRQESLKKQAFSDFFFFFNFTDIQVIFLFFKQLVLIKKWGT